MLKVILGKGDVLETAVVAAINKFNEPTTEARYFHTAQVLTRLVTGDEFQCILWYHTTEEQPINKEFRFIGSEGIDPNDPNWREKLEAFMKEDIQDTPVTSQEAPQEATEDKTS